MAEYKNLQLQLEDCRTGGWPDWGKAYGPEFRYNRGLLDLAYSTAPGDGTLETRNKYLNVLKDELLPIFHRYRRAFPEQFAEVQAVCAKYEHEETGLYATIVRDLDTFLASGPTRHPDLWPFLEQVIRDDDGCVHEMRVIRNTRGSKVICRLEEGQPTIAINFGERDNDCYDHVMTKSYQIMCCRLDKRSTLQQQQIQLLKHLLAENGLQLPPEFATIQQQLDDIKRPRTEEELAQSDKDKGQDACPDAKYYQVIEGVPGSGQFIGIYQNKAKPFTMTPPPPPAFHIYYCQSLLDYLKKGGFIKPFMQRPTEEEAPGYSNVVTRHRDIPMIDSCVEHSIQKGTMITMYEEGAFFSDLRLMVENYRHFFDEGSHQYDCALRLETEIYKKLNRYGGPGEMGKKLFDEPVVPEFNDPQPEEFNDPETEGFNGPESEENADFSLQTINDWDTPVAKILAGENPTPYGPSSPSLGKNNSLNILEKAWKLRDKGLQHDKNVGNPTRASIRHNTQQPVASSSAQPPRPRPDDDETGEQPAGDLSFFDQYSYPDPNAVHFGPPTETAIDDGADDTLRSYQLSSDGEEEAHGSAHASRQPASFAPMVATPPVVDLTSPPQRQTSHAGSASNKRARDSDDQEDSGSSDDDAPLLKKRMIAGKASASAAAKGKAPASASASSSRKRHRDDSDADSDDDADSAYVPEQPSKRQRKTPSESMTPAAATKGKAPATDPKGKGKAPATVSKDKGKAPAAPAAPAASVASSSRKRSRDDDDDGDNAPEQSSKRQKPSSASAQAPVSAEPATTALGHTDQGTITVMQLQRMSKWRTTAHSKGAIANRPWVFGYSFGDQYALYIMRCPTKGCPKAGYEVGPEVFRKHPLNDHYASCHLQECCGDFGDGDNDTLVSKYCKQVISDDRKAVSIEWARKWNDDLIVEYGNDADNDLRKYNF